MQQHSIMRMQNNLDEGGSTNNGDGVIQPCKLVINDLFLPCCDKLFTKGIDVSSRVAACNMDTMSAIQPCLIWDGRLLQGYFVVWTSPVLQLLQWLHPVQGMAILSYYLQCLMDIINKLP